MIGILLLNILLVVLVIASTVLSINLIGDFRYLTTSLTSLLGRGSQEPSGRTSAAAKLAGYHTPHNAHSQIYKLPTRRERTRPRLRTFARRLLQIGIPAKLQRVFYLIWGSLIALSSLGLYKLAVAYAGNTLLSLILGWLGFAIAVAIPLQLIKLRIARIDNHLRQSLVHVVQNIFIASQGSLDIAGSIRAILSIEDELHFTDNGTVILRRVEQRVRQGSALDDALVEEAKESHVQEVIHTFGVLAQCIRHGGPVSKQLKAISDAISTSEELRIYEQVTKLPIKAVLPLTLMFSIFFIYLYGGLFAFFMKNGFSKIY